MLQMLQFFQNGANIGVPSKCCKYCRDLKVLQKCCRGLKNYKCCKGFFKKNVTNAAEPKMLHCFQMLQILQNFQNAAGISNVANIAQSLKIVANVTVLSESCKYCKDFQPKKCVANVADPTKCCNCYRVLIKGCQMLHRLLKKCHQCCRAHIVLQMLQIFKVLQMLQTLKNAANTAELSKMLQRHTLPDLGGSSGPPKGFSSITFDRDKILKRNFG